MGDDACCLIGKPTKPTRQPADIIGNTYEQYLGKALVSDNGSITTRDNLETRKKQGSYYTPQVIVRYIVDNSLGRYLFGTKTAGQMATLFPTRRARPAATSTICACSTARAAAARS
jgi:hypothetical protein